MQPSGKLPHDGKLTQLKVSVGTSPQKPTLEVAALGTLQIFFWKFGCTYAYAVASSSFQSPIKPTYFLFSFIHLSPFSPWHCSNRHYRRCNSLLQGRATITNAVILLRYLFVLYNCITPAIRRSRGDNHQWHRTNESSQHPIRRPFIFYAPDSSVQHRGTIQDPFLVASESQSRTLQIAIKRIKGRGRLRRGRKKKSRGCAGTQAIGAILIEDPSWTTFQPHGINPSHFDHRAIPTTNPPYLLFVVLGSYPTKFYSLTHPSHVIHWLSAIRRQPNISLSPPRQHSLSTPR